MSLQTKIISLVVTVFIVYGALDYGAQRLIILPSFQALERTEAQENMERVVQALERELDQLITSATDWATWDDTYRFVEDRNDTYLQANLNAEALESLRVNLLYIFNGARQPLWGMVQDPETKQAIALAVFSVPVLPEGHPLVSLAEPDSQTKGILVTERGLLLVAAKPVITSRREGPVRGTVVLGQFLDATLSSAIAQQALVHLTLSVLGGKPLEPEEAAVVSELRDTRGSVLREGEDVTRVYRVLPDLFGQPALLVRVTVPKAISAQGQATIRHALVSLFVAGFLILIALLVGLRQMVLEPTRRLTEQAAAVGQKGEFAARLSLDRRDELGVLARAFDQMIERLAEARQELVKQSFQSGIAELASGVLHDIGNAITPLKVRVASLNDTVRSAPTADLQRTLAELTGASLPPQRRAELERLVVLAGRELATVLDQTAEHLTGIARQVDHVQQILSDQERFSRAARVIEQVPVEEVVRESADLLGDKLLRGIQLKLDTSLQAAGAVRGSRVVLQQILVNLLKNAAEAIRKCALAPDRGCIVVQASTERSQGQPVVHLRIRDNGIGIHPAHLSRLFERDFTTKSRPSPGLGLHWCAVTVAAMNGQLSAESAGVGQGACLHLRLRQVEVPPVPRTAVAGG